MYGVRSRMEKMGLCEGDDMDKISLAALWAEGKPCILEYIFLTYILCV